MWLADQTFVGTDLRFGGSGLGVEGPKWDDIIHGHFVIAPLRRGMPGEGPDGHFPQVIDGFGTVPARIRVAYELIGEDCEACTCRVNLGW